MGYTLVNHALAQYPTSGSTSVTTPTKDITGADLVTLFVASNSGGVTVSDGVNTFTARTSYGSSPVIQVFDCFNPTTSASYQVTASGSGAAATIVMRAYSGSVTSPFDQQNGAAVSGSLTSQPGSVPPSVANELLLTAIAHEETGSWSIDSGFTIGDGASLTANAFGLEVADLITASTSSVNPTWTGSGTNAKALTIVTYKPAVVTVKVPYYQTAYGLR